MGIQDIHSVYNQGGVGRIFSGGIAVLLDWCDPVSYTHLDAAAIFEPYEKLDTPEKLKKELAVRRDWAKSYMRDFAPPMPDSRKRLELAEFDWRLETEEDAQNFETVLSGKGDWERVQIPHYGGPVGIATAYYRTEFDVEDAKGLSLIHI